MRRIMLFAALVAALVTTAFAITGGTEDTTGEHPNVGIVVLRVGTQGGAFICSGTLIHPRVVLTPIQFWELVTVVQSHLFPPTNGAPSAKDINADGTPSFE